MSALTAFALPAFVERRGQVLPLALARTARPAPAAARPRTSAWQMLERLPQAVLLIAEARRVVASNRRAQRMLADGQLQLADDVLTQLAQLGAAQLDRLQCGVALTGSFDCGVWFGAPLATGWLHACDVAEPGAAGHMTQLVIQIDQPALTQGARIDAMAQQCRISPTERHVLMLLADGMTVEQVARHLGLQLSTVRSHVRNLLGKTQAPTLMQLLRWTGSAQALPQ